MTAANVAVNVGKGIFGAFQAAKANKKIKNLMKNPVTYKRPEEYEQELAMRKQMAAQQQMPGQGYMEQNIGQAVAQGLSAAEKGAISSNVYQAQVGDILSKQLQAFQDLGMKSAQWQQANKEAYLKTLEKGAGYSDTEWYENKMRPWEMNLNMAMGNKQAGMNNLFGGISGAVGSLQDYAGTKYYADTMAKAMGGGGSVLSKTAPPTNATLPSASGFLAPNLFNLRPSPPQNPPSYMNPTTPYEEMMRQLALNGITPER